MVDHGRGAKFSCLFPVMAEDIRAAVAQVRFVETPAGSATFAGAWPFLMETYETAAAVQQEALVLNCQVVNTIAGEGLHGVLQNLVGAVWFLGMDSYLRSKMNGLGILSMVVGVFLVPNTIGNMFNIEALSLIGLTANILLGPLWSILIGVMLMRLRSE